ncbi:MAG: hypothetical protein K9N47_06830 [Prosthecobacter sp.]|uniref:tetratricopeptide repeat protein n=1 Tax=Prosthecobacter sp. TaxID=1965333 RepID=UPI0025E7EFA8|nr:hypothetical protein [Prosthecobacter sp.]MCF7785818.1 hypothetical protein [Prosthecobacter sp.]
MFNAVQSLVFRWTELSLDELKKRIASLLEKNRRGEYRKRVANVLLDMDDLLANGEAGHSEEVADYLDWRLDHLDADDGFFDETAPGQWDDTKKQSEERTRQWETERYKEVSEISVKADTASVILRPHWLVQCGALEFRHRRYQQAADYFERVFAAFPDHPRAEVAVLMLARMKFDEWKQARKTWEHDVPKENRLENEARLAFERYKNLYSKGRFVADAIGWEAGMAREKGDLSGAMEGFLVQAQTPHHPEIRRRAFQQIEWLLGDLADEPRQYDELPWAKIAAEPCVALRMGYFMLDCESETDLGALMYRRSGEDHRVLETLAPTLRAVRSAAKPAWRELDAALAANNDAYHGSRGIIRDVLHGWSSIMRGEPGLVPVLVKAPTQGAGADDALLVRALAQLKMGLAAEGIHSLNQLDESCPDSPLHRGSDLRRIDAWLELHQPAVAIALLWDMLTGQGTAVWKKDIEESPNLHLSGEVEQRLSALLTFAPLAELEKASLAEGAPASLQTALRGALRVRHLSEGRFAESLRFAEEVNFEEWHQMHQRWDDKPEAMHLEWRESVTALQDLSDAVEKSSGDAKAAAWMKLGAAWEERLWRLLDGGSVSAGGGEGRGILPPASYQLRHHTRILGLSDSVAAAMLDQRQVTLHAIRCYEEALRLAPKGTDRSLKALLALQAALRTRAEFSAYCMDRSVEINAAEKSRMLYDRIRSEHAGTEAARQAVWWTFRPSLTVGEWQPGYNAFFHREVELAALLTSSEHSDYWNQDWQVTTALETLTKKLKTTFASETSVTQLRGTIAMLRREASREAPVAKAGALFNHLDDLDLLLAVPGVSAEARKAYFDARMSGSPLEASAEMFAPMQDFVAFWNDAVTPSTTAMTPEEQKLLAEQPGRGTRQRIAQAQVCRMQEFLGKFPQSVKREAALARLAINTLRQFRCHCGMARIDKVEETTTAYAGFAIERGMPFDRAAVTAALDAYDREFPQGRYHWDVLLMRGIAAAESHEWPAALRHLVAVLENPEQRSLHLDASNNMCAIFMELLTPEQRPAIMQAVKATPGAWQKLDAFIYSPTCGWRLHVLLDWLEAQR